MSNPIFPGVETLLDLLFDELPAGVYADDRADDPDVDLRSNSSSELRAQAQLLSNLYENLSSIYSDKHLTTVTADGISLWERDLFAEAQDGTLPFATRKTKAIKKLRTEGGISYSKMYAIIADLLTPEGLTFELVTWCGTNNGGWILDETELGIGTYLATEDPLIGARRDIPSLDCSLDYTSSALTAQDLLEIQETAYTYEVRILGVAGSAILSQLDLLLTEKEPARSTHLVVNNYVVIDPDTIDMGPFIVYQIIDAFDFGVFNQPDSTYAMWDMGTF